MEQPQNVTGPVHLPLRIQGVDVPFRLWFHQFAREGRWATAVTGNIDDGTPVPLRIESACLFGHVFHSAQCDCGYQLDEALRRIRDLGRGIVIYGIDQDARGLGIASHFQIYVLRQQENLDTEEVYQRLQAPVDARTYDPVAVILRDLGVRQVMLLSNNPRRQAFLEEHGFSVTKQPIEAELDVHNMATLMLEKEDLGYEWSFKTHRDWLQPIQDQVEGESELSISMIVDQNQAIVARHDSRAWDAAAGLLAALERSDAPLARPIVYLTDLPRVDELPLYARTGAHFVVVPFPLIPAWLSGPAAALGLKIQDWGRENKYRQPRPQWELCAEREDVHVYRRGDRVRCVFPGAGEQALRSCERAIAVHAQAAAACPDHAPRVERSHHGASPWLELSVPAGANPAVLSGAGFTVTGAGDTFVLLAPTSPA